MGLKAMKLRLGYPTLAEDLAALTRYATRIPAETPIMVDYNQALTPAEAILRGRALQHEGLAWLEEPIRHDDYRGNAAIAEPCMCRCRSARTSTVRRPWCRRWPPAPATMSCRMSRGSAASPAGCRRPAIAAAYGIEMSSHLMPEISVHLLAASARGHWLEYVDWADAILEQPLEIVDGHAVPPDRPGSGMVWDEARIGRLATP